MAVKLDVPHAVVLAPGEGETVTDRDERKIRILLAHEFLDVTWTWCEPGECSADPHVHRDHVDAFYVLEGELVFGLGPDLAEVRASPGTFLAAPPNLVHTFRNEGPNPACYVNLHAPSTGFADFLRSGSSFDSHEPPADGGRPLADAVFHLPGEGERAENDERLRWIKAEFTELSVLEIVVEPGWTVAPHRHDDHLDSFFVLDGEAEFTTESGPHRGPSGTLMAAPPGALHGIRNPGGGPVRLLNVHAPDAGFVARNR